MHACPCTAYLEELCLSSSTSVCVTHSVAHTFVFVPHITHNPTHTENCSCLQRQRTHLFFFPVRSSTRRAERVSFSTRAEDPSSPLHGKKKNRTAFNEAEDPSSFRSEGSKIKEWKQKEIEREMQSPPILCFTNLLNAGLISADRSNKATLLLTIPGSI